MTAPPIKATALQRKALQLYLTNGGDRVAAFTDSRNSPISENTSKKVLNDRAKKFFSTVTMKALLAEANFQVRLDMERKAIAGVETAITRYGITKEKILEKLAKIAFAEASDVMSWGPDGVVVKESTEIGDAAAAVSEVTSSGGGEAPLHMKVKLMDQRQALIDLGREAFGMFTPVQKVDVRGAVAVAPARFVIEGK